MENYVTILCNQTYFNVFGHSTISNHTFYYLDNCFQQTVLVIPIYLLVFAIISFYIGLYNSLPSSLYQTLKQTNFITGGRYLSIVVIASLQIAIYFCDLSRLTLLAQLVTLLKLCTIVAYFIFLFKCPRILFFEENFKLFKLLILLVACTNLSENVWFYFESSRVVTILVSICSFLWLVHFAFLIKRDNRHQFVARLLINSDADEQSDDNSLKCDEKSSYLSQIFFRWVSPLLHRGLQQGIHSSTDLFELPFSLSSLAVCVDVDDYLNSLSQRNYLIKSLFRQFGWKILILGSMKLLADSLAFLSPIFLNKILLYLESDKFASKQGFTFALALFFGTFFNATIISFFNFQMSKLGLKIRTALITIIYHKLFRIRSSHLLTKFGTGHLLNLANTDIERVVNFAPSLFQFVSLPLQLVITLYLLYDEVGIVFLSAVFFILALIPLNKVICNKIGIFSQEMMKWKDKRIKLMTEILRGIRTIKMHFWEKSFIEKVNFFRSKEVKYLRWRKYLDALCVYFWATTPVIISSLVFGTFVYFNGSEDLTSSKVFTSLALLSMLIMPLNALPWVLNGLVEALVSVRRLDAFFTMQEFNLTNDYSLFPEENGIAFELDDCTFQYLNDDDETSDNFKLSQISLSVPYKSFVAIIGTVHRLNSVSHYFLFRQGW